MINEEDTKYYCEITHDTFTKEEWISSQMEGYRIGASRGVRATREQAEIFFSAMAYGAYAYITPIVTREI